MSLGRQPPPNPSPAWRYRLPMRGSRPMAAPSCFTSAPVASQSSAMALMKLSFVARYAFDADLISSAVAKLQTSRGIPAASRGA